MALGLLVLFFVYVLPVLAALACFAAAGFCYGVGRYFKDQKREK